MTVSSHGKLVCVALAAALSLVACGAPATPTSTASLSPSTPAAQRSTLPTTAPARTTVGMAEDGPCAAAGLRVQQTSQDGAAGHIHFVVAVTNTATSSCALSGYPNLIMLDAGGKPMPTRVSHTDVTFAATPAHQILLAPRASASFDVGYSHVPVGSETSCPAATTVLVQVTTDGKALRLLQNMDPCNHGHVATSALAAGRSGTRG